MKKTYLLHEKVTTWSQIEFTSDRPLEEITALLENGYTNDVWNELDADAVFTRIDETDETLTPFENGGESTLELYQEGDKVNALWKNTENKEKYEYLKPQYYQGCDEEGEPYGIYLVEGFINVETIEAEWSEWFENSGGISYNEYLENNYDVSCEQIFAENINA